MKETVVLYIRVNQNNLVNNKNVYLKDVANIYSTDKKMVKKLEEILIYKITKNEKQFYCFSVFILFKEIDKLYPKVDLRNIGNTEFIIEYEPPKKASKTKEVLKVAFVSSIIFIGAGFTIMTFNEDVSIKKLFAIVYELIMGKEQTSGSLMEIGYAIGLPVGIMVFFNHFSKAKLGIDPTPMQVQIRMYEESLDMTIIENANRKGELIDTD